MAIADDILALGSGITTLSGNVVLAGTAYDAAQVHASAAGVHIAAAHDLAYQNSQSSTDIETAKALDDLKSALDDLGTAIDKQQLVNANTKDALVLVSAALTTLAG